MRPKVLFSLNWGNQLKWMRSYWCVGLSISFCGVYFLMIFMEFSDILVYDITIVLLFALSKLKVMRNLEWMRTDLGEIRHKDIQQSGIAHMPFIPWDNFR